MEQLRKIPQRLLGLGRTARPREVQPTPHAPKAVEEIQPLAYDANIGLDEAKERFDRVNRIAIGVMARYAKPVDDPLAVSPTRIADDDNKRLIDCTGVLLPLSMQPSVQQELLDHPEDPEVTVWGQCQDLQEGIMLNLTGFENSGVRLLVYEKSSDRGLLE